MRMKHVNTMRKFGFLILFLTCTFTTFAIDGLLIKTTDYALKEKWNNTAGASIPVIPSCDTVFKKQYFFLTAIVANYASNNQDISVVQYAIKIIKPDNTIYFSQEHIPVINGKISNKHNLQMGDAVLKICFENNDAFGKYTIEIVILDNISGKSKNIRADIVLAPLPAYDVLQVKDDEAFSKWFVKYYENPQPESALAYYMYYAQSKLSDNESGFWPVFSIFLEIAKNNTWLLPQIMDCYKTRDVKTKIYLLYLLTYANIGPVDFFNSLEGVEKETYLKIKDASLADIYGTIVDPSQLDMLWGTFMASGSYQPILKLIQTLEYTKYQGYLDKYKKSEQTPEDRQNAMNNAIYDALVWSLKSNCAQHKLVRAYCEWAMQHEHLSEVQKKELKAILKD